MDKLLEIARNIPILANSANIFTNIYELIKDINATEIEDKTLQKLKDFIEETEELT